MTGFMQLRDLKPFSKLEQPLRMLNLLYLGSISETSTLVDSISVLNYFKLTVESNSEKKIPFQNVTAH